MAIAVNTRAPGNALPYGRKSRETSKLTPQSDIPDTATSELRQKRMLLHAGSLRAKSRFMAADIPGAAVITRHEAPIESPTMLTHALSNLAVAGVNFILGKLVLHSRPG